MRAEVSNELNLNVSQHKLKAAKKLILTELEGSYLDDYRILEAYAQELRDSNLGSKFVVNISRDAMHEGRRVFHRMFVCFKALVLNVQRCRPLIGLDGTFLHGKCKEQLLVVVSQDSMNYFFPIAWAVVPSENKRNWN
ncbi:hypothetical protein Cni_G20359 [Canna indica]|uniref:MULE transposase domain-containing protein n=1 Tax=Canna indica TaxID=4628 RepID=A0AAQ3QKP3_9LILI|nr:hypothetical protein Cni_G20359 [Canna indica]